MRSLGSVAAVGVGVIFMMTTTEAVRQTERHLLGFNARQTIAEQLLPTDEVVIVDEVPPDMPMSWELPVSAEERVRRLVERSPVLVLVEILDSEPRLVRNGIAIATFITARVSEVFKAPEGRHSKGDTLRFAVPGGTVRVGKVEVRAFGSPLFTKSQRYLASLASRDSASYGVPSIGIEMPLPINGDTLVGKTANDPLNGASLEAVRRAARSLRAGGER